MKSQGIAASRIRLQDLHTRGKKAAKVLEAVTMVVGAAVTLVEGLRALLDIASPQESPEEADSNED